MSRNFLFLQFLVATVMGQGVNVNAIAISNPQAQDISTILAQPTSPDTLDTPKETSKEFAVTTLTAVMNGQEGDSNGPKLRQNLFHFGAGHYAPAQPCPPRGGYLDRENHREHERERPHQRGHEGSNRYPHDPNLVPLRDDRRAYPSVGLDSPLQDRVPQDRVPAGYPGQAFDPYDPPLPPPYLRVTPSVVVQPYTHTHVETSTSTEFDVSTTLRTRTLTEELYSTQTHIFHPERTFTIVDHHTYLEYPGSTIDPARVRGPVPTAPVWADPCY